MLLRKSCGQPLVGRRYPAGFRDVIVPAQQTEPVVAELSQAEVLAGIHRSIENKANKTSENQFVASTFRRV
jgi:hypothetical protein